MIYYLNGLNTVLTRRNSMLDYTFTLVILLGVGLSEEETPLMRCAAGQYLNTPNNCSPCPVGTYILDTNHRLTTCFNCSQTTETVPECTTATRENGKICGGGMYAIPHNEKNWTCLPCSTCSNFTQSDFKPVPCGEYTDTVCCPETEKVVVPWRLGKYICASHCERGQFLLSNGRCSICPEGTYMPHPKHTNLSCKPCSVLVLPKMEWNSYTECNTTHDAAVQCAPGYYRKDITTKCAFSKTCLPESIKKLEALNCHGVGSEACCLELNCSKCEEMSRKIDRLGVVTYANGTKSSKGIVLCDYNEYVNNGESCRPCPPDTFIDSREHTLTRCHPCDAIKINQLPSRCVDEHFLFYLIVLTIIGLLLTLILTVFVVRAIFNRSKPKRKTTTSELKDESDIEISSALKRNVSSEDVDASISDVGAGKVENRQPSDNHLLSSIRQYFIVENKKLIESEPLVRLESFDKEPVEMLEKQYIGSRVEETSINDDEESAIELVEESYPALGDGPSGVEPHNTESPIAEEEITPTAASSRGSLGDTENVKRSESSNLVLSTTPSEKSISSNSSKILSPKQSGTLTSTPSATLTPKPSVTLLPRPSVETTPKLNIGSSVDSFDSSVDDETKPKEKKPLTSSLVKRDGRGLPLSSKGKKVRLSIPIEQEEDEN